MIIKVKVKPHAGMQSVEKITVPVFGREEEVVYYVKLKSLADEGKANLELIKVLKDYFGKEARIRSGFNSRLKFVEILENA